MFKLRHGADAAPDQNGTRTRHRIASDRNEGRNAVFSRLLKASVRAGLVALLVVMPSLILSMSTGDGAQVLALVAIFAALFTFVEYAAAAPSIIEFRDAPPYNRLRFGTLFLTLISLSFLMLGSYGGPAIVQLLHALLRMLGNAMDFPFSPVRLFLLMLPEGSDPKLAANIRVTAGLAYLISLISITTFIVMLRFKRWPKRHGTFNVWVNLPTFDPTAGGDVVARLNRDSQVNVILGFLLPFLIPAIGKLWSIFITPLTFTDPQTMIWMVTAWAFLPASLLMRGVALSRVAYMIHKQRKRAYAQAVAEGMLPA